MPIRIGRQSDDVFTQTARFLLYACLSRHGGSKGNDVVPPKVIDSAMVGEKVHRSGREHDRALDPLRVPVPADQLLVVISRDVERASSVAIPLESGRVPHIPEDQRLSELW
jgi:hypothetical protein